MVKTMKTKNIFKTLVLAAVLVSACSKNEIDNDFKGYTLPVVINVTRQGDDATTRATYTYDEDTKKGTLSFSTGDKLFVRAMSSPAGKFAGLLDYDSETGKFSGTIMTQNDYSGTAEALLAATSPSATLIPAGYDSYSYLTIEDEGTYGADLDYHIGKAFALTKATAVEQFSLESASSYSSGFALAPQNAIVSFTISGLTANTAVAVLFKDNYDISATPVDVTTDASGVATFAVGMYDYANFDWYSLTVDGNAIALPAAKYVEAGHIYNISRNAKVVIWNSSKVEGIDINENPGDNSFESEGITVAAFGDSSASFADSKMSFENSDSYFTFTSSVRKIKKIEINYTGDVYGYEEETPVGWSLGVGTFTWEGDPATSVTLSSFGFARIEGITSIVFTLE